jgi:uncharacterized membrane protein YphA (DoxX/SURF4 family)
VSNTVAWVLQAVLALVFLFHGILYTFAPEALVRSMREQGQWPPTIPVWFRLFIGVAELLAAIGLVLPGLLHVATFFTPLAAGGLVIVTIGATVYHLRRQEVAGVAPPVVLLLLLAVVVLLRWQVAPLS